MSKEHLLRAAEFTFHRMRCVWISTGRREAFSDEVVQDRDEAWLRSRLQIPVPTGEFWFYFSTPPQDLSVCREVLNECGLSSLTPVPRG